MHSLQSFFRSDGTSYGNRRRFDRVGLALAMAIALLFQIAYATLWTGRLGYSMVLIGWTGVAVWIVTRFFQRWHVTVSTKIVIDERRPSGRIG